MIGETYPDDPSKLNGPRLGLITDYNIFEIISDLNNSLEETYIKWEAERAHENDLDESIILGFKISSLLDKAARPLATDLYDFLHKSNLKNTGNTWLDALVKQNTSFDVLIPIGVNVDSIDNSLEVNISSRMDRYMLRNDCEYDIGILDEMQGKLSDLDNLIAYKIFSHDGIFQISTTYFVMFEYMNVDLVAELSANKDGFLVRNVYSNFNWLRGNINEIRQEKIEEGAGITKMMLSLARLMAIKSGFIITDRICNQ